MQNEASPIRRLIRMKRVQDITGLSPSYIYALSSEGKFPQSVPLVPGGVARAWVLSEIEEWVEQRIAERETSAR